MEVHPGREPFQRKHCLSRKGGIICRSGAVVVIKAVDVEARTDVVIKLFYKPLTSHQLGLLRRACNVHRNLHHQCIIHFVEIFSTARTVAVSMPCFPGTNLYDYVIRNGRITQHCHAHAILYQVVHALLYMHNQDVTYRQVKPAHVLLHPRGMNGFDVKLVDFLYARLDSTACHSRVGTPYHVPPEIIDLPHGAQPHVDAGPAEANFEYDGTKVDVWGCGVLLYFMLYGRYPFLVPDNGQSEAQKLLELIHMIQQQDVVFPDDIQVALRYRQLIQSMLTRNPADRISMHGIMNIPWFTQGKYLPEINEQQAPMFTQTAVQIDHVLMQATFGGL